MKKLSLLFTALVLVAMPAWAQETTARGPTIPEARNDWETSAAQLSEVAHRMGAKLHLIFDGDSITQGWQRSGMAVWTERYGKLGAFDFALGGDRTQHILWRLEHGQVEGFNPKLIVLLIGTNNLGRGNTPEETAEGIAAVVAQYRKRCPEATVLLQGIFPRAAKANDPMREKIRVVNEKIAKLADGEKVIFLDFGNVFLNPDGSISPEVMPDFLHLSAKGYELWADAIQPVIDKYFPQP